MKKILLFGLFLFNLGAIVIAARWAMRVKTVRDSISRMAKPLGVDFAGKEYYPAYVDGDLIVAVSKEGDWYFNSTPRNGGASVAVSAKAKAGMVAVSAPQFSAWWSNSESGKCENVRIEYNDSIRFVDETGNGDVDAKSSNHPESRLVK